MNRRAFMGTLVAPLVVPGGAKAQPHAGAARVGFLGTTTLQLPEGRVLVDAFREGLRERGYVEDRNVVLEVRGAEGERLAGAAMELARLKPDVIVVGNQVSAEAARRATRTIPIVAAVLGDPVGDGLAASLARPGGNITGLTYLGPELVPKRLELLKEAFPAVSRVAALWQPEAFSEHINREMLRQAQAAAQALRMRLQLVEVHGPNELERAFATMSDQRGDALLVFPGAMFFLERGRIVGLAAKLGWPAIFNAREFAALGGLMAYGANINDLFRRAAIHVDKILNGAKPGDLPIEQPTKFELAINLETAQVLGLTIPQSLLVRADEVIQ